MRTWLQLLLVPAAILMSPHVAPGATNVGLIQIRGAIGPATAGYISRAINVAAKRNDAALIIQLNTPGGLLTSTHDIVEALYGSPIPVAVYVSPSGALAGSAGTFITMAADVAAMAPNTTIGAAHPVQIGAEGSEKTDEVMKKKLESYAGTFIQTIAEKRGRNAEWARSAVVESAAATAEEALNLNVIDFIATDIPDLLQKMDGRDFRGSAIRTAGAEVVAIPMVPHERVFQTLWRPEVMLVLMLIAIYGILGEINNPGAIFPGVAGAIALVLFLYMATVLPVNVAGIALIVIGVILFALELYTPTHGVLTVGGIVAFFLGALMLFDRSEPGFHLSLGWIIPATIATALFFMFVVGAGLRAQSLPVRAGSESMLGQVIPALERIDARSGRVFVEGEYWNATSEFEIEKDQPVEIVAIEGLTLKVKPVNR